MPQVVEEINNDDLIAAMQGMGESAPEPGTFRVKDVIHAGDGDVPAPILAAALDSAGYVYIYDRKTGERSVTSRNMLPAQLRKLNVDGEKMFTLQAPAKPPERGHFKCWLHGDNRRPEYDKWGLPVCRKGNLMNELEVRQHMKTRHKRSWEAIEEHRERIEREEDRALQRLVLEQALRGEGEGPRRGRPAKEREASAT